MSPQYTQRLTRLLATFDTERIGEGNLSAGANVLAAMACSIANIHRYGACITSSDGASFHVGSSLLASGPLTSSLISERVTTPLAALQTNMLAHLHEWEHGKQAIIENTLTGAPNLRKLKINADLSTLMVLGDEMGFGNDFLQMLLSPLPNQMKRALLNHPLVYVTGATSAQLRRNLQRSHLGRPLVHEVLHNPSQCANLGDCCLPVIDGSMTIEPLCTTVHGHVLLTDPSRVLDEVVRAGGEPARWLLRLPWLLDGNAGPEVSLNGDTTATQPQLDHIEQRYETAMHKAWRCRLDHTITTPVSHAIELSAHQSQWVRYLIGCESQCPGISSAARPLLATLVFGLHEMTTSMEMPAGFRFDAGDVLTLAAHLVQRMCNAHTVMTHTGEKEQKQRKHTRILDRLSEGPQSARDLGRRFHRMTTTECRDLLAELKRSGRVAELSGDRWQLTALPHPSESTTLTLNV
jgi:hypothetical protein